MKDRGGLRGSYHHPPWFQPMVFRRKEWDQVERKNVELKNLESTRSLKTEFFDPAPERARCQSELFRRAPLPLDLPIAGGQGLKNMLPLKIN